MLPDGWTGQLADALEEVQDVVNDELNRQYVQLGDSLRDFLYDLFNYPLERPWHDSLAIFAQHWADHRLKLTLRTLDSIWHVIAAELDGDRPIELAEAPAAMAAASTLATDADLQMAPTAGSLTANTEYDWSGYQFAAKQYSQREQDRLGLTDTEREELEDYVIRYFGAQARGEGPILPPMFWYQKNAEWLAIRDQQPEVRATTKEAQDQRALRWKYMHLDELPLEEQERLRMQALLEQRRRYTEKYGLIAAFLNPAFDGTGTLNDWAMVAGGFISEAPPGLDFRSPRPRSLAQPQRPRPPRSLPARARRRPKASQTSPGVAGRRRLGKKPPFPPPVSRQRVTIRKGRRTPDPRHVKGAKAEEAKARFVHSLPNEVVIYWGDKIGTHGADIISYNLKTGIVTLWDVKWRGKPVRIQPSTTFRTDSSTLAYSLEQAENAIHASKLAKQDKAAAIKSLKNRTFQTRTTGEGEARNSTFGDDR